MNTAILLLGGAGRRLKPRTRNVNKHLLDVNGCTLAENATQWLFGSGFLKIIAVVPEDYESEFVETLAPLVRREREIRIACQPAPIGTGDAVVRALTGRTDDQVAVLFGDNVFKVPLGGSELAPLPDAAEVCCFARYTDRHLRHFGVIDVSGKHAIAIKKPHSYDVGLAMVGVFIVRVSAFELFVAQRDGAPGGEDDLVDYVLYCSRRGSLIVREIKQPWCDAGYSPEALRHAAEILDAGFSAREPGDCE